MNARNITAKVVVVTGGAGFIGSHLCDRLIAIEPRELLIIDDFSLGRMRNVEQLEKNPIVEIHRLDASDYSRMARLFEEKHVDVVFNLAVIPLPRSLEAPKETIDKNILITSTICELLRQKLYQSLIHCSSSEAYGTALYVPMDEKHPTFPLTPYAASKIACDHIAISYYKTFNLDIAVARPFNSYGPRQNEGSYAGVIPITILRVLSGKPPIIHGDGLQTRDYTYVEDTAEAIARTYEVPQARGRIINIASGKEICIKDIINLIVRLTDYKGEVVHEKPRPGDVRRHRGDISLANELLGYSPKTDFETGLRKTVEWYKEQLTK